MKPLPLLPAAAVLRHALAQAGEEIGVPFPGRSLATRHEPGSLDLWLDRLASLVAGRANPVERR